MWTKRDRRASTRDSRTSQGSSAKVGEVAAQKDSPDPRAAEDDYRQALTLAEELAMRPLIARCHVGLGRFYRCEGERKKAEEHLTTGVSMMREMEMGLWLEREAALKELG